ncbi:sensor histidine kinase [Luteimonas sp. R10]|uniref:sensor histidine kinase n=1 Tax=Luteimonas sp. R10 TaxID=3108176 RepID=UPI00308F87B3|nr:histidine kinase [Luteimonas sp. R10]
MHTTLRKLLMPLNLAGLCTIGAVALSLRWIAPDVAAYGWATLAAFVLAFALHDIERVRDSKAGDALLVAMPLLALLLVWLTPRGGTAPVLLVVWTAAMAMVWPLRRTLTAALAADVAMYLILARQDHFSPLVITLMYVGFQGFATLIAHYATSAERSRDALSLVNADLLATRALLADSARDGERVRVARELHDVVGHKLTAMTLNLRALGNDPALAGRQELRIAQRMSQELLGDIRGVVQSLRDSCGLDLATALHALAAPLPRPRLHLEIADDVHVTDPALAETVLRIVQEALTNSARHADADTVRVALSMRDGALQVRVEDDGRLRGALREGNGLAGMRERVAALDGSLVFAASPRGALRIDASLPA